MSKPDNWIIFSVASLIAVHLAVLVIGLITKKFYAATVLNLVLGLSVIIYWIQNQLRITQHYIDMREMLCLGFEVILIASAIYSLAASRQTSLTIVAQCVFFGIHFVALLLFIVFMLTFRINKLW